MRIITILAPRSAGPIGTEGTVTTQIKLLRPRLRGRPELGISPFGRAIGFPVVDSGSRGEVHRQLVHDASRLALQPVIEPREIRIPRPEIVMIDEVVLVGADPQLLITGARLNILERR
jgi:hypothetical protein